MSMEENKTDENGLKMEEMKEPQNQQNEESGQHEMKMESQSETCEQSPKEENHNEESETCESDKSDMKESKDFSEIINQFMESSLKNNITIEVYMDKVIKENRGVVAGDNAQFEDLEFLNQITGKSQEIQKPENVNNESILDSEENISKWFTDNFGNKKMEMLISLAVFHDMPYIWINTNAGILKDRSVFRNEDCNKPEEIYAKDKLLAELGCYTYTGYIVTNGGETEAEFAGFYDKTLSDQILGCIWQQFPDYRGALLNWLKLFAFQANWSQSNAAMRAMSVVALIDYYYFETRVMEKLAQKDNITVLPEVLHQIGKNEKYRGNIEYRIKHYATLSSCHYLLIALLAARKERWSVTDIQPIIENYILKLKEELKKGRLGDYLEELPLMFALGQQNSNYYKALVVTLYDNIEKSKGVYRKADKNSLEQIFYMLLEIDYELVISALKVKGSKQEMRFVYMLFVENEYKYKLQNLWSSLWKNGKYHVHLKNMMKSYWKKKIGRSDLQKDYLDLFLIKLNISEKEQREICRSVINV